MAATKNIALVIGSTRPTRVGPRVANFVHETLRASPSAASAKISIVDIESFRLPLFDEKVLPKNAAVVNAHSIAWSSAIKPFDGYVFVSAEYNAGIPAATKNAIDYLYHEIAEKPVAIVTYGGHGGSSASNHLKDVLNRIEMQVMETRPQLAFANREEMFLAVDQGQLGDATSATWGSEKKAVVLQAFEELLRALDGKTK